MTCKNNFNITHYKEIFSKALKLEYKIITCFDYFKHNYNENEKKIINRIDVDVDCKKAKDISDIFNELGIKATFFIRLHAKEYNPFDFDNFLHIKSIIDSGHEIGLHSEIIDCSRIWGKDPTRYLIKDLKIITEMFNTTINGIASHRGITGFNNLDYWNYHQPYEFSLIYEAYDPKLFNNCFYISDSQITSWKCYKNGILQKDNDICICEHLSNNYNLIYLLTHPMSYFRRHVYER